MVRKNWNDFKSSRTNLEDLTKKVLEVGADNKKGSYQDDRILKITQDKAGNAFVIGRFLPGVNDDGPIVDNYQHWCSQNGKWFIETCPKTVDLKAKCPSCEHASQIWKNHSEEEARKLASPFNKVHRYYTNFYVIKDTNNPENNGKVFVYVFGEKIYNKIKNSMKPEQSEIEVGIKPINVFDMFEGANFIIKVKKVGGQNNYDDSSFQQCSPLSKNDEELEKIYNSMYDLNEFKGTDKIKSYEELKELFNNMMSAENNSTVEDAVKKETYSTSKSSIVESVEDNTIPEDNGVDVFNGTNQQEQSTDVDDYFSNLK
jgi:hypothetical protein